MTVVHEKCFKIVKQKTVNRKIRSLILSPHDIAEIVLKVALNTLNPTQILNVISW